MKPLPLIALVLLPALTFAQPKIPVSLNSVTIFLNGAELASTAKIRSGVAAFNAL